MSDRGLIYLALALIADVAFWQADARLEQRRSVVTLCSFTGYAILGIVFWLLFLVELWRWS